MQKDFSALIHDLNLPLGDGQIRAWADSIRVLKRECHELVEQRPGVRHWGLVFEYELPRERGRRPDVVLLTGPAAHVIEFKGRQYAEQSDVDQVDAYARDLREYHAGSRELDVRPILALDDASLPAQDVDNVTILGGRTLASYLQSITKVTRLAHSEVAVVSTQAEGSTRCYCNSTGTKSILNDIVEASIPEDALTGDCCWSTICRVYSQNRDAVEPGIWPEICAKRGALGVFSKRTLLPP